VPRTLWGLKVHRDMPLVPSAYNFSHVVDWLLEFRNAEPNGGTGEFQQWLITEKGYAPGAALAYCYPLRASDCDLSALSLKKLDVIAKRPHSAAAREWIRGFRHVKPLSEISTSIICTYLVCECIREGIFVGARRAEHFVERGHAGTRNAGGAMNSVGLSIARHFGLVDETERRRPKVTTRCDEVFGK
jgi:hypothetical protein